jgi:ABC-type sugar transport system substrate-binding protein
VLAAKAAKIPLVLVHEDVVNWRENATAFIGQNFVNGGMQKMQQVMKDFPNGGNLAVLYGEVGNKAQIAINEGYREALKGQEAKYPYVFDGEGRWAAENALDLASAWLSSGRPIDAIVCNNDGMAIGALQAVTSVGKAGQILIYGLDAQQDVCAEIKKGVIRATIFSNSDEEAKVGVDTVLKAIRGEPFQKEVLLPMELVTRDNIDRYLK